MSPVTRAPRASTRWVSGAIVTVVALGVLVLVYLAVQHTGAEAPTGTARPVPTFSSSPQPSGSPPESPAPEPIAIEPPRADERFLAQGTGALWRATAGACTETAPLLERSTDQGLSWTDVTPDALGVGQILALAPLAGSEAELIALVGADCEPQALRTFTQGEYWESFPDALDGATYVTPGEPGGIATPAGVVAAPCGEPWGLRSAEGRAALVCEGVVQTLEGSDWTAGADGATAVSVSADGVSTARATPDCAGLVIEADGGSRCVEEAPAAGPTAILRDGPVTIVWSGDTLSFVDGG